jgi:RNA polymerase sigma-70 factor (ECF subfamily)
VDDPERASLRNDAIRLARALVGLMPDEPEAAGLLALMLLSESRVPARTAGGALVLLRDQDRTTWDCSLIEEGQAIVRACVRRNQPGPFQLQAAIQAVHGQASSFEATDWPQIVTLYDHLFSLMPTSVVALNRAIAIGEIEGPGALLAALDAIAPDLDNYHLIHAARGSALRRLGRRKAAKAAYVRAAHLAATEMDRRFLAQQAEELSGDGADTSVDSAPARGAPRSQRSDVGRESVAARPDGTDGTRPARPSSTPASAQGGGAGSHSRSRLGNAVGGRLRPAIATAG